MQALETPGLAQIFNAPVDFILEPTSVVQPDIVIVSAARQPIINEQALEGVPDVVVEILSPGSLDRDEHLKRKLYERFAVPEYWIVDPDHGLLIVHRHDGAGYGIRARYDRASILECPEFPALRAPLADVFQ